MLLENYIACLWRLQAKQLQPLQQLQMLEALHPSIPLQANGTDGNAEDKIAANTEARMAADTAAETAANTAAKTAANPGGEAASKTGTSAKARLLTNVGSGGGGQQAEAGPAADIAAFGRLIVQLYRGRMIHRSISDHRWELGCLWKTSLC